MKADRVYIRGLRIDARIGVHDWERRVRQTLCLDVEMAADVAAAAVDELALTPDYAAISRRLLEAAQSRHFRLLETLAERLAGLLLEEFGLSWVRLRLGKPGAVAAAADVGVVIERSA